MARPDQWEGRGGDVSTPCEVSVRTTRKPRPDGSPACMIHRISENRHKLFSERPFWRIAIRQCVPGACLPPDTQSIHINVRSRSSLFPENRVMCHCFGRARFNYVPVIRTACPAEAVPMCVSFTNLVRSSSGTSLILRHVGDTPPRHTGSCLRAAIW